MTFKKHCLWQPLKDCVVGKSYAPEYYSFIKDIDVRRRYEQIAHETEEDYQNLEKLLQSFGVNTIRPQVDIEANFKNRKQSRAWFDQFERPVRQVDYVTTDCVVPPPMQPRDWIMMMGDKFIHWFIEPDQNAQYRNIVSFVQEQNNWVYHTDTNLNSEGWMTKIGKRMTYGGGGPSFSSNNVRKEYEKFIVEFGDDYENLIYDDIGWRDSWYRPLKPGLIISVTGEDRYAKDFSNWKIITTDGSDGLVSMYKYLRFKQKHNHNLWNYGEEGDAARAAVAYEWLDNGWQQYCMENVFDCNILNIDESNVIVFNNPNKKICNELEKHGINVHVSHYRNRYFWSGGIHCITCDLNRDGELIDYFN